MRQAYLQLKIRLQENKKKNRGHRHSVGALIFFACILKKSMLSCKHTITITTLRREKQTLAFLNAKFPDKTGSVCCTIFTYR